MTDPEFAHRTYIKPITPDVVEKIIIREKPDALLPTLGGQTALNTSMSLFKSGTLDMPRSGIAHTIDEARKVFRVIPLECPEISGLAPPTLRRIYPP